MNSYRSGYTNKKKNLFKAWLLFGVSFLLAGVIVLGLTLIYKTEQTYSTLNFQSKLSQLEQLNIKFKELTQVDYSKKSFSEIKASKKTLSELKERYSVLYINTHKISRLLIWLDKDQITEFNNIIKKRLQEIDEFNEHLSKLEAYTYTKDLIKNFNACINKVNFADTDEKIYKSLNLCVNKTKDNKINKYAEEMKCEEMKKLNDFFKGYKYMVEYYKLLSAKQYTKAQDIKQKSKTLLSKDYLLWIKCFKND